MLVRFYNIWVIFAVLLKHLLVICLVGLGVQPPKQAQQKIHEHPHLSRSILGLMSYHAAGCPAIIVLSVLVIANECLPEGKICYSIGKLV